MSRSYEFSKAANSQPQEVPSGMEGVAPDPSAWWPDRVKTPDLLTKATPVDKLERFGAIGDLSEADWHDTRKLESLFDGMDEWRVAAKDKGRAGSGGEIRDDWYIEDIKPPKANKDRRGEVREIPPEVDILRTVRRDDGTEEEIRRSIPYPQFLQMQVDAEESKRAETAKQVTEHATWLKKLPNNPSRTTLDGVTSHEQNADDDAEIGEGGGR